MKLRRNMSKPEGPTLQDQQVSTMLKKNNKFCSNFFQVIDLLRTGNLEMLKPLIHITTVFIDDHVVG